MNNNKVFFFALKQRGQIDSTNHNYKDFIYKLKSNTPKMKFIAQVLSSF